jgi:serine phosphatase RsbU (regulator of sigma subunit)
LPKDIVSGDFYWYEPLSNNKALFVMGDCTGHGVPAGFMGMIGNTLLRETVRSKGIYSPDLVLAQIRDDLSQLFVKAQDLAYSDGIDMAVGLFEKKSDGSGTLHFAGAKAHIFHASAQGIVRVMGEKTMLGTVRKPKPFGLQQITLQAGDWVYFYSDGLIDQDSDDKQRFGTPRLQALLEEIWRLSPQQQKQAIAQALMEHQGKAKQRDDISLIGLKM